METTNRVPGWLHKYLGSLVAGIFLAYGWVINQEFELTKLQEKVVILEEKAAKQDDKLDAIYLIVFTIARDMDIKNLPALPK